MRILWLTGFVIPDASEKINVGKIPFGGWVSQMLKELAKDKDITVGVVMKSNTKELLIDRHTTVTYYYAPSKRTNKFDIYDYDCDVIINDFRPDLVHAEGCELKYTNTFLRRWRGKNVVSMQGILSGYEPFEYGGLDINKLFRNKYFMDTLFAVTLMLNKHLVFAKRVKVERHSIELAHNILGRTSWDKAHTYFVNKSAPYYHIARILRPSFYDLPNRRHEIIRHSIFLGNSAQPRKGAHFVLDAIRLLLAEYPDIHLYISGDYFDGRFYDWRSFFGYRAYLKRKIKRLGLTNHVTFTGVLQEKGFVSLLSKMHVFVLSSAIENSPNTLGEAMITGVPCIASYNGGVPDMARDGIEALFYRYNDPYSLALQIKRVFDSDELASSLISAARIRAKVTHDRDLNFMYLRNAYNDILKHHLLD